MKALLEDLDAWIGAGRRVVIAQIIGAEGSGPRDVGTQMAINDLGEVSGSLTGGCVESAIVGEAIELISTPNAGRTATVSYGISDDELMPVGLMCGGTVTIFLQELDW